MKSVHSQNSKIELRLRRGLWEKGLRYRVCPKNVIGKPDIVFIKEKLAIFCDSEFWHGKDWDVKKNKIHSNVDFWQNKIEANMRRDLAVNERLSKEGWTVVRFWGERIETDLDGCVNEIIRLLMELREMAKRQKANPIEVLVSKDEPEVKKLDEVRIAIQASTNEPSAAKRTRSHGNVASLEINLGAADKVGKGGSSG